MFRLPEREKCTKFTAFYVRRGAKISVQIYVFTYCFQKENINPNLIQTVTINGRNKDKKQISDSILFCLNKTIYIFSIIKKVMKGKKFIEVILSTVF